MGFRYWDLEFRDSKLGFVFKKTEINIARQVTYKQLLKNRNFKLLVFAQAISNFGDWLIIGILVSIVNSLVPNSINPALAIAGLWISKIAPSLIFSPFIGAFVDRLDRKKGMIYSDIARGFLVATLPLATVFGGLIWVYSIILLTEIFTLFFVPAKDASIPNLVKRHQLIEANSLSFTINQITMLVGLGVGTTLIIIINNVLAFIPVIRGLAGTFTAIYIDSLTFFISAIAVAFIRMPKRKIGTSNINYGNIIDEVKDTFRFIASNPKIKSIIISAGFSVLGLGTILIVGPEYAQVNLGLGRDGFLILLTLLAVGLVFGAISSSWLTHLFSKESLFSFSLSLLGASLVALALSAAVSIAIILSLIAGYSLGVLYVTMYTMFHERVSDVIRGRLFTALEADLRLGLIASALLTGGVAALVGDQAFSLFGIIITVSSAEILMFSGGVIVLLVSIYAFRTTRSITRKEIIAKLKRSKTK